MNRIRELRTAHGWKQEELGAKIGASRSTISKYETEDRQLDPSTICTLCDLFGCTSDYLLGRTASPEPVISDDDARLLEAYHAASLRDRTLVDQILAATMPSAEESTAAG